MLHKTKIIEKVVNPLQKCTFAAENLYISTWILKIDNDLEIIRFGADLSTTP